MSQSLYGGFPTRKMQAQYAQVVFQIVGLMQTTLIDYISQAPIEESFFRTHFIKLYKLLDQLESRKYVQPKFCLLLEKLNMFCYQFVDDSYNQEKQQEEDMRNKKYSALKRSIEMAKVNERSFSSQKEQATNFAVGALMSMKWPDADTSEIQKIHPNTTQNVQESINMNSLKKRVRSGTTNKKVISSRENMRPNTSVRKQSKERQPPTLTMENEVQLFKQKSQTIYLMSEKQPSHHETIQGSLQKPQNTSIHSRKQLYNDLQRYYTTLDINQHLVDLPQKRRKPLNRPYRIAQLF